MIANRPMPQSANISTGTHLGLGPFFWLAVRAGVWRAGGACWGRPFAFALAFGGTTLVDAGVDGAADRFLPGRPVPGPTVPGSTAAVGTSVASGPVEVPPGSSSAAGSGEVEPGSSEAVRFAGFAMVVRIDGTRSVPTWSAL